MGVSRARYSGPGPLVAGRARYPPAGRMGWDPTASQTRSIRSLPESHGRIQHAAAGSVRPR